MKTFITTFYSPGAYAKEYEGLRATASEFGLTITAKERNVASWHDAVMWKPFHILQQLYEIADGDGLLWTDADSRFRRQPDFSLFKGYDFSCARFRWSKGHPWEYLSGTMYFKNTNAVRRFVEDWCASTELLGRADRDTPEQTSLGYTLNNGRHKIKWLDLPVEWVFIEPDFRTMFPDVHPIVSHLQASRVNKK